ncbi:MAG: dUTP diphosphatase [Rhizobiaceae bacterium]|nr:dUTP diphosphatase [Rhizobiaceae bacterium]
MLPTIAFVRLPHSEGLPLPAYETAGAAGMDLRAAVAEDRPLMILPGKRALVPTGLMAEIPAGFEGQVRPRSGLALKHGITCLNTPGTIDSDYRGELKVLLVNLSDEEFSVTRGMRIAQLVIAAVSRAEIAERSVLPASTRGAGGFGSTGTG